MSVRPIIIDCDPGLDDAVALLLAFVSPELKILGITTVAGNVSLSKTTNNALKLCELAGRTDVPVYAGCSRPILKDPRCSDYVHGDNGLGDVELPEPKIKAQDKHAVDFIIDTILSSKEKITLVPMGPLTNIALAIIKEPKILSNIQEIIIMGGSTGFGNVTPSAEFNFFVDPHAASVVFKSGANISMIGLDVTHDALATPEKIQRIREKGTKVAITAAHILAFYSQFYKEVWNFEGPAVHDPCIIAYMIDPSIFKLQRAEVLIETSSPLTWGRSVVDLLDKEKTPNTHVAVKMNAEAFFDLLTDRMGRYS